MHPQRRAGPVPYWARETLLTAIPPRNKPEKEDGGGTDKGESMNKHLNDAKSLSTFGVCRPITGGEHTSECSVCTGRMRDRQRGDKAAFLQAQIKITAFVTVQQMNIYWQKFLGLTYTCVNLKCYDNIPHSSIWKNYKAISKTATPRTQSWQIKHFGSGQPFKFLQGQTHPGELLVRNFKNRLSQFYITK